MYSKNKYLWNPLNHILIAILFFASLFLSSCNEEARGFALPKGDIEEGRAIYEKLDCNTCHRISGIEWKGGSDSLNVNLGGAVTTKKTYGELVTSVINPSHKIAPGYKKQGTNEDGLSKMLNYNEVMTVQELIDLVAFLQSEYEIKSPPVDYYPYY